MAALRKTIPIFCSELFGRTQVLDSGPGALSLWQYCGGCSSDKSLLRIDRFVVPHVRNVALARTSRCAGCWGAACFRSGLLLYQRDRLGRGCSEFRLSKRCVLFPNGLVAASPGALRFPRRLLRW